MDLPSIDEVETLEVRVPRRARNRITTSYATLPDAHHALVRIRAGDLVGYGEAPAELWWTGEDASSVRNAIAQYLAPAVRGARPEPRVIARSMNRALAANPYAKAAVEMAVWDIVGKASGLGLNALLGGSYHPVPIKYVIGMVDPTRAHSEAQWGVAEGFTTLKVKVGGALESDLARVEAVIDAAGGGVDVGVDVNGGWDGPTAMRALEPLSSLGISFLEQPVSSDHPDVLRSVTERSSIPVVAHESIFTVRDGFAAARSDLAHIWALTPSTHGGLVPTLDLLGLARSAGIPCLLGGTVELGIATAFLAHIGSAFETIHDCPVPSDVIGPLYHESDIVSVGTRIEGGFAHAPSGPGLGITLDEEAIASFAEGPWE